MIHLRSENKRFKHKRQGEKIKGTVPIMYDGIIVGYKKTSFRLHKCKPKGCSSSRRICIMCLKSVINKNDSNYESKVCKSCS